MDYIVENINSSCDVYIQDFNIIPKYTQRFEAIQWSVPSIGYKITQKICKIAKVKKYEICLKIQN